MPRLADQVIADMLARLEGRLVVILHCVCCPSAGCGLVATQPGWTGLPISVFEFFLLTTTPIDRPGGAR